MIMRSFLQIKRVQKVSNHFTAVIYGGSQGAQKLTGENLKQVWAEFSTLS
jgi:hypothetical protein